jgi:ketosteroid isomerase-like protein
MSTSSKGRKIVEQFFNKLGKEGDTEGFVSLVSPDVVVDTPFSPKGQPTKFKGRDEIRARFADARATMKNFEFIDTEILATEDPERWVATCKSRGNHLDGREYTNTYCWMFRISDNKIVWWCEY